MADPRFFHRAGPFSLSELAEKAGAELRAADDATRLISDVAPLATAGAGTLSFIDNRKYLSDFATTAAAACLVAPAIADRAPDGVALLVVKDPYRSYALLAALFYPTSETVAGIHPTALVDATAEVAEGVQIGPYTVIGAGVRIGPGASVGAYTHLEKGVEIGAGSRIGPHCSLSHTLIGDKCLLHSGVRIGQDGFGFAMGPQGHLKVPQLGRVLIGSDVEIGANTTIDRGAGPDTVIEDGVRIDNLVQIGHNVHVGAGSVLVSQVGIAGSSRLGRFVVAGGQVGIAGHLTIGDGVQIAAQSGIIQDVETGAKIGGSPAVGIRTWHRQSVALKRLATGKGKESK